MKASAPEKLYLISDEDGVMLSYDSSAKLQYGNRYDFVDKEVFPIEEGCEVEYIRKDSFIEKACQYIREHKDYVATEDNGISGWIPECFIEDFKEYMNENS